MEHSLWLPVLLVVTSAWAAPPLSDLPLTTLTISRVDTALPASSIELSSHALTCASLRLPLNRIFGATAEDSLVIIYSLPEADHVKTATRTMNEHVFTAATKQEADAIAREVVLRATGFQDGPRARIVVNPRSGEGHAPSVYNETVQPMLSKAGWKTSMHLSTSGHDTKKVGKDLDCDNTDFAIAIGGDGTFTKMLSGVLERDDWQDCVSNVTFYVIPAGSGNGLATNILKTSGLDFSAADATLLLSQAAQVGNINPLDVSAYEFSEDKPTFGMLALEWALVSDLDEESDFLRWLGPTRFDIYAIIRTVFLRKYTASISYLPANTSSEILRPNGDPRTNLLPKIDEPVPSTWKTIDGPVSLMYITQLPWIASTAYPAPKMKIDEGASSLVLLRGNATRWQVLDWLLGLGDGKSATKVPETEVDLVQAYRLEPTGDAGSKHHPGHIGVDGDFYDAQTVQAQINHNLIRLVYRHNSTTLA